MLFNKSTNWESTKSYTNYKIATLASIHSSIVILLKVNIPNNTSMASYNNNLWFFFILGSFHSTFATTEAPDIPFYLNINCSTNITTTNAFRFNLRTLLSSLSSNATGDTQFYNTTVTGLDSSESVYGLFICWGDVPSQLCHQCVENGTQQLSSDCSSSRQAVIWYEECMVRFSNRFFFSTMDTRPRFGLSNNVNISTNQGSFMSLMFSTVTETANEAARHPIGVKKFATREATISELKTLYCLAQCTPDLSPGDCRTCLSGAIGDLPWCCEGRKGGRVLYPSCNVR